MCIVYRVCTCVSVTCINIYQCDMHVCVIYMCEVCVWREPPGDQRVVSVILYDFLPYSFESKSLAVPGVHGSW